GAGGCACAPPWGAVRGLCRAGPPGACPALASPRRTRVVWLLIAAIALQAAALAGTARSSGAAAPYLAIKMFYLAIYPMAIAVACLAATLWHAASSRRPGLSAPAPAWIGVAILGAASAWPAMTAPRPRPVVTEPVLQAAAWARQHASHNCIDYLTRDGYTAYWLHLAVFGNPRASGRAMNDDTFEPKKALVRWILPGG